MINTITPSNATSYKECEYYSKELNQYQLKEIESIRTIFQYEEKEILEKRDYEIEKIFNLGKFNNAKSKNLLSVNQILILRDVFHWRLEDFDKLKLLSQINEKNVEGVNQILDLFATRLFVEASNYEEFDDAVWYALNMIQFDPETRKIVFDMIYSRMSKKNQELSQHTKKIEDSLYLPTTYLPHAETEIIACAKNQLINLLDAKVVLNNKGEDHQEIMRLPAFFRNYYLYFLAINKRDKEPLENFKKTFREEIVKLLGINNPQDYTLRFQQYRDHGKPKKMVNNLDDTLEEKVEEEELDNQIDATDIIINNLDNQRISELNEKINKENLFQICLDISKKLPNTKKKQIPGKIEYEVEFTDEVKNKEKEANIPKEKSKARIESTQILLEKIFCNIKDFIETKKIEPANLELFLTKILDLNYFGKFYQIERVYKSYFGELVDYLREKMPSLLKKIFNIVKSLEDPERHIKYKDLLTVFDKNNDEDRKNIIEFVNSYPEIYFSEILRNEDLDIFLSLRQIDDFERLFAKFIDEVVSENMIAEYRQSIFNILNNLNFGKQIRLPFSFSKLIKKFEELKVLINNRLDIENCRKMNFSHINPSREELLSYKALNPEEFTEIFNLLKITYRDKYFQIIQLDSELISKFEKEVKKFYSDLVALSLEKNKIDSYKAKYYQLIKTNITKSKLLDDPEIKRIIMDYIAETIFIENIGENPYIIEILLALIDRKIISQKFVHAFGKIINEKLKNVEVRVANVKGENVMVERIDDKKEIGFMLLNSSVPRDLLNKIKAKKVNEEININVDFTINYENGWINCLYVSREH